MAQLKHIVRQATVLPAVTGTVAGGGQAAAEANPGKSLEMVPTSTMNEFGDTVKTHVAKWVSPETVDAGEVLARAAETGSKVALTTAAAILAYHGAKHLMNKYQFGQK